MPSIGGMINYRASIVVISQPADFFLWPPQASSTQVQRQLQIPQIQRIPVDLIWLNNNDIATPATQHSPPLINQRWLPLLWKPLLGTGMPTLVSFIINRYTEQEPVQRINPCNHRITPAIQSHSSKCTFRVCKGLITRCRRPT